MSGEDKDWQWMNASGFMCILEYTYSAWIILYMRSSICFLIAQKMHKQLARVLWNAKQISAAPF